MSEDRDDGLEPLDQEDTDLGEDPENEALEGDEADAGDLEDSGEPGEDDQLRQPGEGQGQRPNVRPSRSRGRFERVASQLAEERRQRAADKAEFDRRLGDISRQLSETQRTRTDIEERERVALMAPEERISYEVGKVRAEVGQQLRQAQFLSATQGDQAAFRTRTASDPIARKHERRVEELAAQQQASGQFLPREMILSYLVGEEVRQKAERERAKQARTGRGRVAAQTTRPAAARADTGTPARGGNRDYAAVMERLKGATF